MYNSTRFHPSYLVKGDVHMSQKRDKGYSQKGKPAAETARKVMAVEDVEKAIHPTKRQNSEQ
jgi:hypothetical protein